MSTTTKRVLLVALLAGFVAVLVSAARETYRIRRICLRCDQSISAPMVFGEEFSIGPLIPTQTSRWVDSVVGPCATHQWGPIWGVGWSWTRPAGLRWDSPYEPDGLTPRLLHRRLSGLAAAVSLPLVERYFALLGTGPDYPTGLEAEAFILELERLAAETPPAGVGVP